MHAAALAALLLALQGTAGRPVVSVEVRPATVAVGEPFIVRVRVQAPAGEKIILPAVPDSSRGVEALDPRVIEDHSSSERFDQTATYRFVAWETGRRTILLDAVRWERARGSESVPFSDVAVEITTMLPADTAQQIPRDARAMFPAPPAYWRWALVAIVVMAIAWLLRRAWRRRARVATAPDAFADAQAGFRAVEALALVEAGEPGRAVLAYAELMRAYLTRRFPQASDGLTTPQFLFALDASELPILPADVAHVLETADAVKFAGLPITADDVARIARMAQGVVRDVQVAYEARLEALDKGKGPRGRRKAK